MRKLSRNILFSRLALLIFCIVADVSNRFVDGDTSKRYQNEALSETRSVFSRIYLYINT